MPAEELNVSNNFNYLSGSAKRRALCIACSYPGSDISLPGTIPDQEAMVHTLSRNGCAQPLAQMSWDIAARAAATDAPPSAALH